MVSYWLYVAVDATPNTGKKTSKMVDLIFSEALILSSKILLVLVHPPSLEAIFKKASSGESFLPALQWIW